MPSGAVSSIVEELNGVLLGKEPEIRLSLCALLARGHLLVEDLPGMGKTTLAHGLANCLGLQYSRVQFTSDLLPSDILGLSIYDREAGQFSFHPGPIFSQVLLADEINRTTPRTQSALLEAMAERQVSIDGETRPMSSPFFVIATQNPAEQVGTYPLPESQLDRFLIRISIGYPDQSAELDLYRRAVGRGRGPLVSQVNQIVSSDDLIAMQSEVDEVDATDDVLRYISRLVRATRSSPDCQLGLSPRGALALLAASKAWAYMEARSHVVPDDVQAVFLAVATHRLTPGSSFIGSTVDLARSLLETTDVLGPN